MRVAKPKFSVLYNGKNITADIAKYMLSITYTDKTEGESDEVEIELEDVDALWQNSWYPEKGAKLTVVIETMKCGVFEIDEIEMKGPPDTVTIKGIATSITKSLRTKKSDAHEKKTLKQIAQKVAEKNGLTIDDMQGVPDITFDRITQNKETDLGFLKRISKEHGVVFSVRDNKMTFMSVYDLEKQKVAFTISKLDVSEYSIKDKADGMVKQAHVSSKNMKKNESVSTNLDFEKYKSENPQYTAPAVESQDTYVDHSRAENKQQAESKAKAIMHLSASNQQVGNFGFKGNPRAVGGVNFTLLGFGKLSGKWHIKVSKHTIYKSGGYKTDIECKRLQTPTKSQQFVVKKKKSKSKLIPVINTKQTFFEENVFGKNEFSKF